MFTTTKQNNPNEGKRGVAAPPEELHKTKFARTKAIFEHNGTQSAKNISGNLEKTFGPTMRRLMRDNNIDVHGSTSALSKQRRGSGDSGISSSSDSTFGEKLQGKRRFSLSSSSSSCSEKSNISDISDKSNNSNIVRCSVTRSNSKEDLRKPDIAHSYKSENKKPPSTAVRELIRQFEQGNNIVKGR